MRHAQIINRTGDTGALLVKVSTALVLHVTAGYHHRYVEMNYG